MEKRLKFVQLYQEEMKQADVGTNDWLSPPNSPDSVVFDFIKPGFPNSTGKDGSADPTGKEVKEISGR